MISSHKKPEEVKASIKQFKKAASRQIVNSRKSSSTELPTNKKASASKEIWKDLLASKTTRKIIQNTWTSSNPKNNKTDVRTIIKQLSQEAKRKK